MFYYLFLCLVGVISFASIIGYRNVFHWSSIAGFYLLCFILTYFVRPWYIFDIGYFTQFYQLGVEPIKGWWTVDWLALKLGLAIVVGLTSFALVYRCCLSSYSEDEISSSVKIVSQLSPLVFRRLKVISLVFFGIALACILFLKFFPELLGGLGEKMALLDDGGSGFVGTTGYIELAERFIIPACVLYFLTSGNMLTTLFMAFPFVVLRLWIGYSRQSLFQLAFSLVIASLTMTFERRGQKIKSFVLALTILAMATLSFGILGKDRAAFQKYYTGRSETLKFQESTAEGYTAAMVGFEISLHWLKYTPEVFPHTWGANYLYAFFILPIPRILWPEKHNIFAPDVSKASDNYLFGFAPGSIGDAWQNGGWLGVVVLFGLAGAICGWGQRARNWNTCPMTGLFIYITMFPLAIGLVRDGPFVLAIQFYFIGLPALISYLVERRSSTEETKTNILRKIPLRTFFPAKIRDLKDPPPPR